MDMKEMMTHVDHTLLSQTATWEEMKQICDDALEYHTASVCIPPCYVKAVAKYLNGRIAVCTVIGFPNGYSTTKVKALETEEAIRDGADEIDMVINLAMLRDGRFDEVEEEIRTLKRVCGEKILKVIIETCLLTEEEKIKMCEIVSASGANYIKTSTGLSTGGATREDIALFAAHVSNGLKIKAAGGIRTFDDAEAFVKLGATRLGTSALVKLMKNEELGSY